METLQKNYKPVWAEGICLGQQHLQQWEQYFENNIWQRVRYLRPYSWGILHLVIDDIALTAGYFRVLECVAIFSNGTLISYNVERQPPLQCQLTHTLNNIISIYLCLPIHQKVSGISGYSDNNAQTAWRAEYRQIADLYDCERSREVLFAVPNLQLLAEDFAQDQFYSIKIAEIACSKSDQFEKVKGYIPPMMRISAASNLMIGITQLIEILAAKINILRGSHTENLLLMIFFQAYTQLSLIKQSADAYSPHDLYQHLLVIASSLAIYSEDSNLLWPQYSHTDFGYVFLSLQQIIIYLIDCAMPKHAAKIELIKHELLYNAKIDTTLFEQNNFILGVQQLTNEPWIERFIGQVKIAAPQVINQVIASALPGVKLIYAKRLPQQFNAQADCEYFYLDQSCEDWLKIKVEKQLSIFLPKCFSEVKIEMMLVRK